MYGPPQDPQPRDSTSEVADGVQRFRSWGTVAALVGLGVWQLAEALPHGDWTVAGGALALVAAAGLVMLADRVAGGEPAGLPTALRSPLALRVAAGVLVLVGLVVGFAG